MREQKRQFKMEQRLWLTIRGHAARKIEQLRRLFTVALSSAHFVLLLHFPRTAVTFVVITLSSANHILLFSKRNEWPLLNSVTVTIIYGRLFTPISKTLVKKITIVWDFFVAQGDNDLHRIVIDYIE